MRGIQFVGAILVLAVVVAVLPSSSEAVTSCKVHVSSKTGLIDVFASGVSGPLLWGDRSGSESTTFANASTCIAGGSASKCEFGAPGTAQAITPPDLCRVYLKDSGPECTVFVKGCTPGPRFTDQAKADDLKQLVAAVSFHHSVPTIEFSGVNVQIDSGSGTTNGTTNGAGNLIIGYNEQHCLWSDTACATDADCTPNTCNAGTCTFGFACSTTADCGANVCPRKDGSHNLVVGPRNSYSSYGGIVAGDSNTISSPSASVTGGDFNTASGPFASVTGGRTNTASGEESSVTGGGYNTASGGFGVFASSVSGGRRNTASGDAASVSGGENNTASWIAASVSGGAQNTASGEGASASGGDGNTASGAGASVSGGDSNAATAEFSSVSGGEGNRATAMDAAVSGGESNVASAFTASVSGGGFNTASAFNAWVSGGNNNTASGGGASVSGGISNVANGEFASVSGGASLIQPVTNGWAAGSVVPTNVFVGDFESP